MSATHCEICGSPWAMHTSICPHEPKSTMEDVHRAIQERNEKRIQNQRAELRRFNECLREKNVALDALHYVWCDGGCRDGVHRWTEGEITEEIVLAAERNARRLRTWLTSKNYRDDIYGKK